jgi:hypothetical protein
MSHVELFTEDILPDTWDISTISNEKGDTFRGMDFKAGQWFDSSEHAQITVKLEHEGMLVDYRENFQGIPISQ